MANLSNINGKFVVEQTTGYVGIGTTNPNFLIEAVGTNAELALNASSIYRVRSTSNDEFIITKNGVGDRLVIVGGGNVGIGTSSPVSKLHVVGEARVYTGSSLGYWGVDAGNSYVYFGTNTSNYSLSFQTSGTERMKIDTSGTIIGIGTYTAGNSIKIFEAKRNGGAVAGDWSYDDATTDMSLGTSTAHSFSLKTGNTRALTINSSGNVGIGTTSPSKQLMLYGNTPFIRLEDSQGGSKRLDLWVDSNAVAHIDANQSAQQITFRTASTDRLRITNAGNVGIGTTSPTNLLDIKGNGSSKGLDIHHSNGNMVAQLIHGGSGDEGQLKLYDSNSETVRIAGENNVASFINSGNVGIGTTGPVYPLDVRRSDFGVMASFRVEDGSSNPRLIFYGNASGSNIQTTWSSGASNLMFHVGGSEGGASEVMRIDSAGQVGIGTTSPTAKLEVVCANGANAFRANFGSAADIFMGFDNANPYLILQDNGNTTTHNFKSNDTNNYIVGSNLGIGTTTPAEKLVVAGNIKANDVDGKFYTNAYVLAASDTFVNTVTVTGTCLYEYTIAVNPNTAGSSAYVDYYYGKVGIGIGWNGSAVTQYIFQDADETAPRSLYSSGGGNISISIRMIYSGGVYTELPANTTAVIRFQGFSTSNTGTIYLRRLA